MIVNAKLYAQTFEYKQSRTLLALAHDETVALDRYRVHAVDDLECLLQIEIAKKVVLEQRLLDQFSRSAKETIW